MGIGGLLGIPQKGRQSTGAPSEGGGRASAAGQEGVDRGSGALSGRTLGVSTTSRAQGAGGRLLISTARGPSMNRRAFAASPGRRSSIPRPIVDDGTGCRKASSRTLAPFPHPLSPDSVLARAGEGERFIDRLGVRRRRACARVRACACGVPGPGARDLSPARLTTRGTSHLRYKSEGPLQTPVGPWT